MLPGIGQFTIVDSHTVNEFDCENNFFVDQSRIGKPRAEATKELLLEMNPDVKGNAIVRDSLDIINNSPSFFVKFSLVIATQLDEVSLQLLSQICAKYSVPLIVARTYGLIGHLRIFSTEHRVLELKLDPQPAPNLRIFNPFPSLQKLAKDVNFGKLDQYEFQHVPFVLILVKLLEEWRESHDGKAPSTRSEKEEFKAKIKQLSREPEEGMEQNLIEAINNSFTAFSAHRVPEEVNDILNDKKCSEITSDSSNFWILARALREFREDNEGLLPVPGTLPDMTATTTMFIQLQKCFTEKAVQDYALFSSKVDAILLRIDREPESISEIDRHLFCSNSIDLVVIRYRTLQQELESPNQVFGFDEDEFSNPPLPPNMNPIVWYLFWRCCDQIYSNTGKYPGQNPEASEEELLAEEEKLLKAAKSLVDLKFKDSIPISAITADVAKEMIRFGATEIHNISALIGGLAAEESVKLLTQQYQPLNNTFVFNGIASVGKFFEL